MSCLENIVLLFLVLSILCLSCNVSSQSVSLDKYLIDCGSSSNVSLGNRLFLADDSDSNILKTLQKIFVSTKSSSNLSTFDSKLYQTARVFSEISQYTFPIRNPGRHWIRLHFFPFVDENHNLSSAKFSVSAQSFTLLKDFQMNKGSTVKEYSLNISSNTLVLTFTPSSDSFAFINALEVIPLPDDLLPGDAKTVGLHEARRNFQRQALETVMRVNMGNQAVSSQNDTLGRSWVPDGSFLIHNNEKFVSNMNIVKFRKGFSEEIAPKTVYGTATKLNTEGNPIYANVSWYFDASPGFEYLVRFHLCDIVNSSALDLSFNVYINSWFVSSYSDISNQDSNAVGVPYYLDVVAKVDDGSKLKISVGPRSVDDIYAPAFLNGLEIMKLSNSKDSFVLDSLSSKKSERKIVVAACLAAGLTAVVVVVASLFLICRRRRKLSLVNGTSGNATFSGAEIAYRFPLVVIQEATDNFSENLVIGVGGFGKVYKGVLRDNREVAVKRGGPQSTQGLVEFRTEIEMLSQFRHRHLVSLIGYCYEQNEMIIIYEYMENGTLKEHLYGSYLLRLSWRQRLQICIGSARGLHYLHTGPAKAIIHRDVKSANILLDENFMAKVADFGLSKTGPGIDQTHVSTAVKGSFGYLDPEYLIMQQLTAKSDVYSFGVVMLEVLCGRPVINPSVSREKVNLIEWAMRYQKRGQLELIVDPCIEGQVKPESLSKFGEIVEKCLAERSALRPTMGDVLWNLEYVLQLQGPDKTPNDNVELSSSHVSQREASSESHIEVSTVNLGDLADVSMSKVFAQLVREETG
ncbi:Receptor-like protein kinase HERK 1 [Morus notabilis]|uniref:Receptor-like protein kinase HERK 1 n=1 Tax=Morus notabilis TaxID=981085 RepID=W9RFT8_9ROSA|nr:receptor-like protein kinase HERK 1 [Morus notabilis]EXB88507.1 Receptor-like protein kinase HERK 1 [Morus notabilis]